MEWFLLAVVGAQQILAQQALLRLAQQLLRLAQQLQRFLILEHLLLAPAVLDMQAVVVALQLQQVYQLAVVERLVPLPIQER
jgi:hypothetical protein